MMRIRNLLVLLIPLLISVAAPDLAVGQTWNIGTPTASQTYNQGSIIAGSGMASAVGATAVFSFEQKIPFDITGTWVVQGSENVTAVNMAGMPRWSKNIDPATTTLRVLDQQWPLSQMGAGGVREKDYKARIAGTGSNAETTLHQVLP